MLANRTIAKLPSLLYLFLSSLGPPSIEIENGKYQLYPVNRRLCPGIDKTQDTIFELYTRKNPVTPQILLTNDEASIKSSNIDFNLQTIIFFHGFLESSRSDDAVLMRQNYLKLGNVNVILVNNERLLAGPDYITASMNVYPIGEFSGKFIDFLVTQGLQLSQLHIIGMSLGGQIAGITGKKITSGKASRITGLDPAGPSFNNQPQDKRIGKDDAEFVDIIHTNAGIFGTTQPSGHVDIWVNGGTYQPGCSAKEVIARDPTNTAELIFCNHYQAYRMYIVSLMNATSYPVTKCDSYSNYKAGLCDGNDKTFLGENVSRQAFGKYFIKTNVTAVDVKPS